MSEGHDDEPKEDVVLLHSPTESGEGIRVIRKREEGIEVGELRPMREGQPIHGDVVRLTPREESELLFDCEVVVPAPSRAAPPPAAEGGAARAADPGSKGRADRPLDHKGPPRVTSDAYRGGWDLIFGGKRRDPGDAPN